MSFPDSYVTFREAVDSFKIGGNVQQSKREINFFFFLKTTKIS